MNISLEKKFDPYPHWEYFQCGYGNCLRIVPERGGLVSEWFCQGKEVLYFDKFRFKDPAKSVRGGMPVLFPICGNMPGDLLHLTNGDFILKQHGFARDSSWELSLLDDKSGICLALHDNASTLSCYPFSFRLIIEMRLLLDSLEVVVKVFNDSNETMPFSFGLHPYFLVNDLSKVRLEGLPAKCFNHRNMREVDTSIELKRLNSGVDFLAEVLGPVSLTDEVTQRRIELHHQSLINYTVIWSDPPRNMICVEPWSSPREALHTGDHRLTIDPGKCKELSCKFLVIS